MSTRAHAAGSGLGTVSCTLLATLLATACARDEPERPGEAGELPGNAPITPPASSPVRASGGTSRGSPPRRLYLLDAGGGVAAHDLELLPGGPAQLTRRCPAEMVDVAGRFCIDRYEAVLVDAAGGRRLSPYFHPTRGQTRASLKRWREKAERTGSARARRMAVPEPPAWQLQEDFEPRVEVRGGEVPSGYLSGDLAERVCERAGKRLCTREEWVRACRGSRDQRFPYGDRYREGVCNVFRSHHPAAVLHGDASSGHLDPRLNLVEVDGEPLLRPTGATPDCRSEWGADAIYDMVGNLDEWVDDAGGVFAGGFYARATREGCEASISAHPRDYFDYSLGVRCCR